MLNKLIVLNPKKDLFCVFVWLLELLILFGFQYINYNFLGNSTLILLAAICLWVWVSVLMPGILRKLLSLDNKKNIGSFDNAEKAKQFIDQCFD